MRLAGHSATDGADRRRGSRDGLQKLLKESAAKGAFLHNSFLENRFVSVIYTFNVRAWLASFS